MIELFCTTRKVAKTTLYMSKKVKDMDCFICQKSGGSHIEVWNESCGENIVAEIIKQHLPWLQLLEDSKELSTICRKCWTHLDDFHQFYVRVKNIHEIFKRKEETDEIILSDYCCTRISENLVTEEISTNSLDLEYNSTCSADVENNSADELNEGNIIDSDSNFEIPLKKRRVTPKKRRPARFLPLELENTIKNNNLSDDEVIKHYIVMACDICAYVGQDFTEISKHLKNEHEIEQPYIKCCGRKLNKKFKILEHAYRHQNPEYFKCKECHKVFADSNILRTHWLSNHAPEDQLTFACDKCPKRFSRQHFLDLHTPSHIPIEERTFFCPICPAGKAFASDHKLQVHINVRHKKATNVCHICAKVIRDNQSFEKHVRLHSENSGPRVKCPRPDCDSWLKDEDNLKQHLRRHNDEGKEFLCNECGKVCKNRRALASHIAYAHTQNEEYTCEECKKSFKKAISLKEHMAQHTGEALYKCPFCPRMFNSNANMHAHKKRMHPVEWEHWRKTKTTSAQKFITASLNF